MSTRTLGIAAGGAAYYVRDLDSAVEQPDSTTFSARATGRVYYTPFQVRHVLTVDGIIVIHGGTAGGRLYVALYDVDPTVPPQPRNRLAVSADTAASGTNRRQYVAFTAPIQLQPGIYFGALEIDNNADTYMNVYPGVQAFIDGPINGLTFFIEDLGAYGIPPAVATPVVIANTNHATRMRLRVSSIP